MIPVKQFSASSVGSFSFCEQKYFITYVLGKREKTGKKALLGTMVHKVLEMLAQGKKYYQDNPNTKIITIDDKEIGTHSVSVNDFFKEEEITEQEIQFFNKLRKDNTCILKPGHKRIAKEFVTKLLNEVYIYYIGTVTHKFEPIDFKSVCSWAWTALDYGDGMFDPRTRYVVQPEHEFLLELDFPWSKYDFQIKDKKLAGNIKLKGFIDLVTDLGDDTYEIVDYKTGQRKDWATGEEKTYAKLQKDPQLLIYYYAATRMFPKIKSFVLTIFFIRDGGPFSIHFDRKDLVDLEAYLNKFHSTLQSTQIPKMVDPMQRDFKCTRLCEFYKEQVDGKNYCRFIHDQLVTIGMAKTIENNIDPNHSLLKV